MALVVTKFAVYRDDTIHTAPAGQVLLFESEAAAETAADFYEGEVCKAVITIDQDFVPRRSPQEAFEDRAELQRKLAEA